MQADIKHEIESIDRIICEKYNLNSKKYSYRKFGNNYIKSSHWPFGVYRNIKTHSELSVLPSTYKRKWVNLLLQNIVPNRQNYSFTDLAGPLFGWYFLRKYFFQVQANFIFYKDFRKGIVLLYKDLNFVIKGKLLANSDETLIEYQRTHEAYEIAKEIGILKIPAVHFHFYAPNKYSFFLLERFVGITLNRLPKHTLIKNIEKMCNFLFLFYSKNNISLKVPEIDLKELENILKLYYNAESISKFLSFKKYFEFLLKTQKKCFWGKTHGDIHTRNLVVDKNNDLWLIDWQASKYEFIAMDLRKINDNDYLFNSLMTIFPSQQIEIMNKIDQVFVGHFLYLQRKILQQKVKKFYQAEQTIDFLDNYCKKNKLIPTI